MQQDSAVPLWVEDEEVQSLVGAGAPLSDRRDCGRDRKAEVVQENPAVGLGCAEMVEGCSAALLHPQEVLKDCAGSAGDLDVGEPGRNRCLSLQTGLVQTAEMDLVVQHQEQQNRAGVLWILPDMVQEDQVDVLGPGEEERDDDGVLPAVMDNGD